MSEYERFEPPRERERYHGPRIAPGGGPVFLVLPLLAVEFLFRHVLVRPLQAAVHVHRGEIGPALPLAFLMLVGTFATGNAFGFVLALCVISLGAFVVVEIEERAARDVVVGLALVVALWISVSPFVSVATVVVLIAWHLKGNSLQLLNRTESGVPGVPPTSAVKPMVLSAFGATLRRDARSIEAGDVRQLSEISHEADLILGNGLTFEDNRLDGPIAAHLKAHSATFTRSTHSSGHGRLVIMWRDPFAGAPPIPWSGPAPSLWQPIPVGMGETGETVSVRLVERNVLVGGEPGGGKTSFCNLVIASAAADPDCELFLLDAKGVDLILWEKQSRRGVALTIEQAIKVLEEVKTIMHRRRDELRAKGLQKVEPGWPTVLLAIDELAAFVNSSNDKAKKRFNSLLEEILQQGRAFGIVILAATQKPSERVVPTAIRDLFGYRVAFRCTTRDASDCVLGAGYASLEADASKIRLEDRGVCWLLAEGNRPRRMKAAWLGGDELKRRANQDPLRGILKAR